MSVIGTSISGMPLEAKLAVWDKIPDPESLTRTIEALRHRGISVELVANKIEALKQLTGKIPDGAEVMTGASASLEEIGFADLLKSGSHHWKNARDQIMAEKDPKKQRELRKKTTMAEYFLGSVQAIAETGEVVIASASGSQIPAYAFLSDNVFWVVGAQKIVSSLDEGLRRVREYCLPIESARMKGLGYPGSVIGKLLVFEREMVPGRQITVILVNEKTGV